MTNLKTHDLYEFMRQLSTEMSAEYNRIQVRATEDPGTAGDQGEKNWAELLRDWLPRNYEVVTKGRIISHEGVTSPQIDVLVLKGSYPKKLLSKKLYLAAGVAAAFECKTTLKTSHIAKAVENCAKIKNLYPIRKGTPYKELHTPLVYGLLAHSHIWKGEKSTPEQNIDQKLCEADSTFVSHPRLQLDVLCVADLAAWTPLIITLSGQRDDQNYSAVSSYIGHTQENQVAHFTSIGVLISHLSQKLAWENPEQRDIADYYQMTNIGGVGMGHGRSWPSSIYSNEVRPRVVKGMLSNQQWDEWSIGFS